ncbi:MAG: tetratricopeptide repeat protein [bacterium]|nr:tetratricopeptide repeat protein [bacterium]
MIIRREKFIVLMMALAVSFLLYGNSINGDFVSDDKLIILQNPLVSGNFSDFVKVFSAPYYYNQPHAGLYRPLTIASYNLNKVFSNGPLGFHLFNIILNAINGFLVFLLVFRLVIKYSIFKTTPNQTAGAVGTGQASDVRKLPYLAMILFLFLPIHSEAVSSIVGRAELLAFLFSTLSLLFVLDKRYAWASIALLAGLLSKEMAVGFFLVFLYIWKFKEHKTLKQVFSDSLYFIPSIAAYAIMRVSVLGKYFVGVDHLMAYNPLRFAPFFSSLWTSFKVFYLYLLKTIVPYQLSSDYSFNQIPIIKNPFLHYEVYVGVTILAVVIYLLVKHKHNVYGLSAAIFLLTYLPVSNWLVKIGTIMGERLMYAPSLGLAVLIALIINKITKGTFAARLKVPFVIYVGLTVLLSWYGYVIIDRNRDWKNEPALLKSGYEASPNSVVSITNMGIIEFGNGNYRDAGKWAEKALAIEPNHVPALFLVGHAYKSIGNLKSAESAWLKLVEISPNYVMAYLSLGILYYEQGRLDKAEVVLAKGFELERTWGKAFPLALVKINRGKYDEAIQFIVSNFGENPEKREFKFALGLAYLKKGDKQKAEFYLSQTKDSGVSIEDYFKKVINQKVFKINEY